MFTPYLDDFLIFILLIVFEAFLIKINWEVRVTKKGKVKGEKNPFRRWFDDRNLTWLDLIIWMCVHLGLGFTSYYYGHTKILHLITGFVASNAIWDAWQKSD